MRKTIVKLIARFVGNKCVTFDGSRVYYWGVPMIVLPMKSLAYLQYSLDKEFGSDTRGIFYSLGKIQGRNGSNILIEKFKVKPNSDDLSFFMEQTEFVGIGRIDLLDYSVEECRYDIRLENSSNAKAYLTSFGKRDTAFCDYERGLMAGALQAISKVSAGYDGMLEVIEEKCICKGDEYCLFKGRKIELFENSKELPKENEFLNEASMKQTLSVLMRSPVKGTKEPSTDLQKLIKIKTGERPFIFKEDGIVTLLSEESLITPIDMYVWLRYVLHSMYGEKVNSIFYETGKFTGKLMVDHMFEELRIEKDQKHHRVAFDIIGLFGLGRVDIAKMDTNNHEYIFRVYMGSAEHHKALKGISKEKVDFFLCGIFSGILSSLFNINFFTEEDSCVVNGSQFCIFKSKKL